MDFSADRRLSIVTAQYLWGPEPDAHDGEGDKIADSRVEAWEFIVGGGAGFNHLNRLYTPEDPAGKYSDLHGGYRTSHQAVK